MTRLRMLTTDDKLAEIRRLYFQTTRESIQADLTKALDNNKVGKKEQDELLGMLAPMRKDIVEKE